MTEIYNNFKELLFKGEIDLDNDTIEAALVSDTPAYTPDVDTEVYVADVLDGGTTASELSGTGYARKSVPLTISQNNTTDEAEAASSDLVYNGIEAGVIAGILVYKVGSDDTDSPVIAYITSADFPLTTNGGDVTIEWDASGVLTLG